jgi:hypothetical protein
MQKVTWIAVLLLHVPGHSEPVPIYPVIAFPQSGVTILARSALARVA